MADVLRRRQQVSKKFETEQHIYFEDASKNENSKSLIFGLIVYRICNVFLVQTWFVPDEFWQGPEVAHKLVFGYGYMTWEWREGIRGYFYPLVFSSIYKVLYVLKIDYLNFIIYLPRIIQAILAAIGEFYIYKLARFLYGYQVACWVLFCHLTSWFMFYCCTRTLTNSMEASLFSIGLYYWELSLQQNTSTEKLVSAMCKALLLASLSCLVRPTAVILWVPVVFLALTRQSVIELIVKFAPPIAIFSLSFSLLADSYFYGKIVLVQYNFLKFNILHNFAEFYGSHSWHWYLSQGLPVVLLTHLIPFGIGVYYQRKAIWKWLVVIIFVVAVYSCLGHKEFRFIFPVLPIAMIICGQGLYYLSSSKSNKDHKTLSRKTSPVNMKILVVFLILTNVPFALYMSLIHQRGSIDVMRAIQENVKYNASKSVLFLMPCHSTPFYSYIHQNIGMRFLDCSPNSKPGYVDEADLFYENPQMWLDENYSEDETPSYILLFDVLFKKIETFLSKHFYTKCGEYFYSHLPSGRLGRSILFMCKKKL